MSRTIRLALVGDRLLDAAAQAPVAQAVAGLGSLAGRNVGASWIPTTEVDAALKGFDGVAGGCG